MFPNLIKHIQQYVEIDNKQQTIIESYVKIIKLKKKALLLNYNQICKSLYFVEKGCVRMYFVNNKGIEQTAQFATELHHPKRYKLHSVKL